DVATLFNKLKINNIPSKGNDSVTGFFLSEDQKFSINLITNKAVVGNTVREIKQDDAFRTETGLYLKNTLYGELFGLNLKFNFRSLSLELKTSHELPVIKELRLEQMRKNIDRLSGVVQVDTTIRREYHFLRGGMADWSVSSMQVSNQTTDTRVLLAASSELLGGEVSGLLNYSTLNGLDERQQQYKWRWVNNESQLVKQIQIGKFPIKSTSSLYAPFTGVSVSNTPVTFRRSYGSYTLSDYTEPGWTVELYINNVIVDYKTADASGFYSFEVPLVYGASVITQRFYGPWGEERMREETINIPYNFVPKGQIEYNVTGGLVRDTVNNSFSRAEAMYGVNKSITIGAGMEYFSGLRKDEAMPFIAGSARFLKNFLFTGDYTYGVKSHGLLSYRLPSNVTVELDYTKYVPGQKAISYNYLEERRITLSFPVRTGKIRTFSRMAYRQNVLPMTTYSSAEVLFSSFYKGVSANISAYGNWISDGDPYLYSNLALGFKLSNSITLRPQSQFNITNSELVSLKAEIEKNFSRIAHLSFTYEENIRNNYRSFEFTFRFDLPFAQTSTSARMTGKQLTTSESARGSFAFGSGGGYIHPDNRNAVSKAGITVIPFLDLDNNGIKSDDEPIASGLNIRINGGRVIKNVKDSLIRVIELEPYVSYLLELGESGFENIAWQLPFKSLSIMIDPSQFKKVYIPIKIMGEANGVVSLKKGNRISGQGRVIINFYDNSGKLFSRTLTESDGYFNFLGLPPGEYTAMPDTAQLNRLKYVSTPASFNFTIHENEYGDIIDDISFTLESKVLDKEPETIEGNSGIIQPESPVDSTKGKQSEFKLSNEPQTIEKPSQSDKQPELKVPASKSRWYVQAGAYYRETDAMRMQSVLTSIGYTSLIIRE
ncbi:MAG TPA: hypothetical protein VHO68_02130, partial [Bacteroidales bacterium]|nr:hypothetical protein [Bacteroidales bacterium]